MAGAPLLLPDLDAVTVARFAGLCDERAALVGELARGYTLTEPIVSPTGKVVGTRVVLNPALAALRQLDKALDGLADRLGLVPSARARLGLTITTAERAALDVESVLASKYARKDPHA
jgi:hypothetical protein